MVPNVNRGRSFKGLFAYLGHDKGEEAQPRPQTSERVGFVRSMNFEADPGDNLAKAATFMAWTWGTREDLKAKTGIKPGGRASNARPVWHSSLSWKQGDPVDRAGMERAAASYLEAQGLALSKGYQTVFICHTDTAHPHVHIVVNLVHPETGKQANPYRDKAKAQAWARAYEKQRGQIFCHEREAIHASRDRARPRHASREAREAFNRAEAGTGAGPRPRQTRRGDPDHQPKADRYGRDRTKAREPRKPAMRTQFRQAADDPHALEPARIIEALTAQRSTFTRRDLARHIWTRTADAEDFRTIMARVEADPQFVRAGRDAKGVERFTARDLQAIERRMMDDATALHERAWPRVTGSVTAANRLHALHAIGLTLTGEQTAAFEHITGKARIAAVVGFAGSGKSTMLGAARLAWEAAGYRVRGAALSSIAAEGLENGAGIDSGTIHSLLNGLDKGFIQLWPNDVLVIDEAGMVGSRLMARLLAHAAKAGTKIVLVGDPEQLQAIDAGAAFRAIKDRIGAAEITAIRRQRDAWQQAATRDLATERTAEALDRYEAAGMVHGHATAAEAKQSLIDSWNTARQATPGATQIILAYRRADVRDLNEQARALRRDAGELGADHAVQTEHGVRQFATGDRLYFLKNDRRLGVRNGSLGTVESIEGDCLTVRLDGGKRVSFSAAAYSHIDHGYAATVHKSQGVTVDRTHVLASEHMDRHAAYVAMTRHRDRLDLHWAADSMASREALASRLGRDGHKDTTLDYGLG